MVSAPKIELHHLYSRTDNDDVSSDECVFVRYQNREFLFKSIELCVRLQQQAE